MRKTLTVPANYLVRGSLDGYDPHSVEGYRLGAPVGSLPAHPAIPTVEGRLVCVEFWTVEGQRLQRTDLGDCHPMTETWRIERSGVLRVCKGSGSSLVETFGPVAVQDAPSFIVNLPRVVFEVGRDWPRRVQFRILVNCGPLSGGQVGQLEITGPLSLGDLDELCSGQGYAMLPPKDYNIDGRVGALFLPENPLQPGKALSNPPLVLFIHGVVCTVKEGEYPLAYKETYPDLFQCLVSAGFAIASVRPSTNALFAMQRGIELVEHIPYIIDFAKDQNNGINIDFSNAQVVTMGHSRGAEAAVIAGFLIRISKSVLAPGQLRAVLSLAPTSSWAKDVEMLGPEAIEEIGLGVPSEIVLPAQLTIAGSLDGDVGKKASPLRLFDQISYFCPYKGMFTIDRMFHWNFTDALAFEYVDESFGVCETQIPGTSFGQTLENHALPKSVATAIVGKIAVAFLRWQVLQDLEWEDFFHANQNVEGVNALLMYSTALAQGFTGAVSANGFSELDLLAGGGVAERMYADVEDFSDPNNPQLQLGINQIGTVSLGAPIHAFRFVWEDDGSDHWVWFDVTTPLQSSDVIVITASVVKREGHGENDVFVVPQNLPGVNVRFGAAVATDGFPVSSIVEYEIQASDLVEELPKTGTVDFDDNENVFGTVHVAMADFPIDESFYADGINKFGIRFLNPSGYVLLRRPVRQP